MGIAILSSAKAPPSKEPEKTIVFYDVTFLFTYVPTVETTETVKLGTRGLSITCF